MVRKAYALIYGLLGKGDSADSLYHGEKLDILEHGEFLRAEFDRLTDAFEVGLSDFRRFRESSSLCAVQRSTFVALIYVLARAMGCSTDEAWRKNLAMAHSFLLENAVFDFPTKSREVLDFRAAISPRLSQRTTIGDPMFDRHRACGLILRRWQYLCRVIRRVDFERPFDGPRPLVLFWDGRRWTETVPSDLREIAGPCASDYGRGMGV
jgi:hypothetical protein